MTKYSSPLKAENPLFEPTERTNGQESQGVYEGRKARANERAHHGHRAAGAILARREAGRQAGRHGLRGTGEEEGE